LGGFDEHLDKTWDEDTTRFFAALIYLNKPHLIHPLYPRGIRDVRAVTIRAMDAIRDAARGLGLTVPDQKFCDALQHMACWFYPYTFQMKTANADSLNVDLTIFRLPLIPDQDLAEISNDTGIDYYLVREELRKELQDNYSDAIHKVDIQDNAVRRDSQQVCASQPTYHVLRP
jgi:hypothetical protein